MNKTDSRLNDDSLAISCESVTIRCPDLLLDDSHPKKREKEADCWLCQHWNPQREKCEIPKREEQRKRIEAQFKFNEFNSPQQRRLLAVITEDTCPSCGSAMYWETEPRENSEKLEGRSTVLSTWLRAALMKSAVTMPARMEKHQIN